MKSILVVDNQGGTLYCNVNTVRKSFNSGFISAEENLRQQTCPPALLARNWGTGGDVQTTIGRLFSNERPRNDNLGD